MGSIIKLKKAHYSFNITDSSDLNLQEGEPIFSSFDRIQGGCQAGLLVPSFTLFIGEGVSFLNDVSGVTPIPFGNSLDTFESIAFATYQAIAANDQLATYNRIYNNEFSSLDNRTTDLEDSMTQGILYDSAVSGTVINDIYKLGKYISDRALPWIEDIAAPKISTLDSDLNDLSGRIDDLSGDLNIHIGDYTNLFNAFEDHTSDVHDSTSTNKLHIDLGILDETDYDNNKGKLFEYTNSDGISYGSEDFGIDGASLNYHLPIVASEIKFTDGSPLDFTCRITAYSPFGIPTHNINVFSDQYACTLTKDDFNQQNQDGSFFFYRYFQFYPGTEVTIYYESLCGGTDIDWWTQESNHLCNQYDGTFKITFPNGSNPPYEIQTSDPVPLARPTISFLVNTRFKHISHNATVS